MMRTIAKPVLRVLPAGDMQIARNPFRTVHST